MTDNSVSNRATATAKPTPVEITQEGYDRLRKELESLRTIERPALVRQARRSMAFQDPKVGPDFVAADRFDLSTLDRRIAELEKMLKDAEVIKPPPDDRTVQFGSRVTVRYEDDTEQTLTLVGPDEVDLMKGYISSESPAGKALLGKAKGDKLTVGEGDDALTMTVVSIGKESEPVPTDPDTEGA